MKDIIELTSKCTGSMRERKYWIKNELEDYPICQNCGQKLSSRNFINNGVAGYRKYCGKKCSKVNLDYDIINQKRKETNMERYGTEGNPWYFQKFRDYLKNKYGIDFIEIDKCLED
jgi:hypothetical protein